MKKKMISPFFILLTVIMFGIKVNYGQSKKLLIKNVTIIDCTGSLPRQGMDVLITGNLITGIRKSSQVNYPAVLAWQNREMQPGLWIHWQHEEWIS